MCKLFRFCVLQDVIKDPEAYATQQLAWNQQHQTFLNKYSRSGQIKSVCDGADALQEERYRNRFREERVARSTEYVPFCLFCFIQCYFGCFTLPVFVVQLRSTQSA